MQFIVMPVVQGSQNLPGHNIPKEYMFTSVHSSKVISIKQIGNQFKLVQKTWTESQSQRWRFRLLDNTDPNGMVSMITQARLNGQSNLVVASPTLGIDSIGRELIMTGFEANKGNQLFSCDRLKNGNYRIRIRHLSNVVLSVENQSLAEDAELVQARWTGAKHQQWQLAAVKEFIPHTGFDARAEIFQHARFEGTRQILGIGSYNMDALKIGNDQLSSLKVSPGLRVTLYKDANFRGDSKSFTEDTTFVGNRFNDQTSAIVVEQVATIFEHGNFTGPSSHLGIGTYDIDEMGIKNDRISSIKVPQGLIVTMYADAKWQGQFKVYTEDAPTLIHQGANDPRFFNDKVSSIVVKAIGAVIPPDTVKFGDQVGFMTRMNNDVFMYNANNLGALTAKVAPANNLLTTEQEFTVVRSGDTKHQSYLCYGDTISLRSVRHNRFISVSNDSNKTVQTVNVSMDALSDQEKFTIIRTRASRHNSFIVTGQVIALRALSTNTFLRFSANTITAFSDKIDFFGQALLGNKDYFFKLFNNELILPNEDRNKFSSGVAIEDGNPFCDLQESVESVCGIDACIADACAIAACGFAAGGFKGCGFAAAGFAYCGSDAAVFSVCAAAANVVIGVTGIGVCGGDACGAAVCGAAACGAAACGAAACGAAACGAAASLISVEGIDVCGVEASVADACAVEASAVEFCTLDACAANVCAINLCPADACAADACAIDIIPIIPGI